MPDSAFTKHNAHETDKTERTRQSPCLCVRELVDARSNTDTLLAREQSSKIWRN